MQYSIEAWFGNVRASFNDEDVNDIERYVRSRYREYAKDDGIDDNNYLIELKKRCVALAKDKIQEKAAEKDKSIIRAYTTLEELRDNTNSLYEKLLDWYKEHFPELKIGKDKILEIIYQYGSRKNILNLDNDNNLISNKIRESAEKSKGIDLSDEEDIILKEFSKTIKDMLNLEDRLNRYLDENIKEMTPNLSLILSSTLVSQLIFQANGLKKLAFMPSSKIQVLGAEKALFNHLSSGTPPPKHGIIFQHPYIKNAKPKDRGKRSRNLASKIAILARIDYFTGLVRDDVIEAIKNEINV